MYTNSNGFIFSLDSSKSILVCFRPVIPTLYFLFILFIFIFHVFILYLYASTERSKQQIFRNDENSYEKDYYFQLNLIFSPAM